MNEPDVAESIEIVTYYLEMTDRAQLRPARPPAEPLELRRAEIALPELNRFLYAAAGRDWHWMDRRSWSYGRWLEYLERPDLQTWVGYARGTPMGYFELELQPEGNVEFVYFGLLPRFLGQKLGGPFLTEAVGRAWDTGARRVWLHTCTLDHPYALRNYMARGFRLFKEQVSEKQRLLRPEHPW